MQFSDWQGVDDQAAWSSNRIGGDDAEQFLVLPDALDLAGFDKRPLRETLFRPMNAGGPRQSNRARNTWFAAPLPAKAAEAASPAHRNRRN